MGCCNSEAHEAENSPVMAHCDAMPRRPSRTLENGFTSMHAYDADGRLTSLTHGEV